MSSTQKNLLRLNKIHRTSENSDCPFLRIYRIFLIDSSSLALTDVVRVTDENIPKYRQANYEAIQEIIHERRVLGSQALQRGKDKGHCPSIDFDVLNSSFETPE